MRFAQHIIALLVFAQANIYAQTSVNIPNIFTPDGDGTNEIFRIGTAGYSELTCTIINRNGEPVYRFYGINGSWDGFTHAGVKVTAGTYYVFLELTLPDGTTENRQGALQVHY